MDASQKKISFVFSKLKNTNQLVKPVEITKKEVEYVDSFDGEKGKFSFQGFVRNDEVIKKPLVIPLVGTRSAYEVIKAKLKIKDEASGELLENDTKTLDIKEEFPLNSETVKVELEDVKPTLEALAAKEIIDSLNGEIKEKEKGIVIVPDMEKPTFEGEKESTLDDYENVPVDDFGLALLRGMGWTPQTGIGKENRVVAPIQAKLRPKRLGLGAEGSMAPPGERPPLKKGSMIQVVSGQQKGRLGIVEGLDADTASVFVKVEGIGTLSVSENVVVALTKDEYDKKINGKAPDTKSDAITKEKKYGIIEKERSRPSPSSYQSVKQSVMRKEKKSVDSKFLSKYNVKKRAISSESDEKRRKRRDRSLSDSPLRNNDQTRGKIGGHDMNSSDDSVRKYTRVDSSSRQERDNKNRVNKKGSKVDEGTSSSESYDSEPRKKKKKRKHSRERRLKSKKRIDRDPSSDTDSSEPRNKKGRCHSRERNSKSSRMSGSTDKYSRHKKSRRNYSSGDESVKQKKRKKEKRRSSSSDDSRYEKKRRNR